jgi:uncharacterized protein YhjY with autotransporter beta-barrel domain
MAPADPAFFLETPAQNYVAPSAFFFNWRSFAHVMWRPHTPHRFAAVLGVLSGSLILDGVHADPAAACTPVMGSGATISYDCRGARGFDAHTGSNHGNNGARGGNGADQPNFIQGDVALTANTPAIAAYQFDTSGGDGGNGHDWRSNPNHWGGNGGDAGNLHFTLDNKSKSFTNQGGNALALFANGGSGGAYATQDGYGQGGSGGSITAYLSSLLLTAQGSPSAAGLQVSTAGGAGARSNVAEGTHNPIGGHGGSAGTIIVNMAGTVVSTGYGLLLTAAGGQGGEGTGDAHHPSGDGGAGGAITLNYTSGTIEVTGPQRGIDVMSSGGAGGSAAPGRTTPGGQGARGGDITIDSSATITMGAASLNVAALSARSVGGAGGNGGDGRVLGPTGKPGGNGGDGGTVVITNAGKLTTSAVGSAGIHAVSEGGKGGSGGADHGIIYADGGRGGKGGAEDDVTVTHSGSITTGGDSATGIFAKSLGGGGAVGGNAGAGIVSVGGSGANGGHGGKVTVITQLGTTGADNSFIKTSGKQAYAIDAESTGGGGGNGGNSFTVGLLPFTLSIGGSGGGGGAGGEVTVNNGQALTTSGSQSHAVFAESTGGGGGDGGVANLASVSAVFNFSLSLGGTGGGGGNGGKVTVINAHAGPIVTHGFKSYGIFAHSVGGGGGSGGSALSDQLTLPAIIPSPLMFNMALGGKGGGGGAGGDVSVTTEGTIHTSGKQSAAIFAQSVGGGGGHGGISTVGTVAAGGLTPWSASIGVGGTGGLGGNGGAVSVLHDNGKNTGPSIETDEDDAVGIYAQSAGGGGGKGGLASNLGIFTAVTAKVGGNGGGSGDGGTVTVTNAGYILTKGKNSHAIFAESIGGGGGDGGGSSGLGLGLINIGVGGNAGGGGSGNQVKVWNGNVLETYGANADGIFAHSAGGGGGIAMMTQQISVGAGINAAIAVGGKGGNGGAGGAVTVEHMGAHLHTYGAASRGIFAQSVGGGGGVGGAAWSGQLVAGIPNPSQVSSISFNMALGGTGGQGGNGGTVDVTSGAGITTSGAQSTAIFAQSLGGGGGQGGASTAGTVTITPAAGPAPDTSFGVSETLAIGGSGGGGGKGAVVTVKNTARLTTQGDSALGIFGQSIGGGGGNGGSAIESVGAISLGPGATPNQPDGGVPKNFSFTLGQSVGGHGGNGNTGGDVTISHDGWIATNGAKATGIFAQSTGGGGGNGGSSQGLSSSVPTFTSTTTIGGKGGTGNHGGNVTVNSGLSGNGFIKTEGTAAAGIFAQSVGGGGGNGGNASNVTGSIFQSTFSDVNALQRLVLQIINRNFSIGTFQVTGNIGVTVGGAAGAGGQGGNVSVTSAKEIKTSGQQSPGIFAQSVGGGGGNGGSAGALSEASLAQVIVDGLATISGGLKKILSPSVNLGLTISVGGSGGAGGNGGTVTVTNSGSVSTTNSDSPAILAQSIGGGGGNGGGVSKGLSDVAKDLGLDAQKFQLFLNVINALPWSGSLTTAFSVGGSGGAAGDGGQAKVDNTGTIKTTGANSEGIFVQSIGGGGGNGAHAAPMAGAATFALNFEVGGKGGGGGQGGTATATNAGRIETSGVNSVGIIAQSIGGGGGKSSQTFGGGLSFFNPSWGGNWYSGLGASGASGHGGTATVTVKDKAEVVTHGVLAHGIIAQSIGNGGGVSLFSVDDAPSDPNLPTLPKLPTLSVSNLLGATSNSARGDGGNAVVSLSGSVQTSGASAFGVMAQSIGDGGGYSAIGSSSGDLASAVTLTLGASGDATGYGGQTYVTVTETGKITTTGQNALGILAQSIGAGGGVAGLATTSGLVKLGDDASAKPGYGDGGAVNVTLDGKVETSGDGAAGVVAQSIGGGGGLAGNLAGVRYGLDLVKDAGVTGGAGQGGAVSVTAAGKITTTGANAPAILAMSVASGAVLTDAGLLLKRPYVAHGNVGGLINIGLGPNAVITASGVNSPAIYAVSTGNSGAGVGGTYKGSDITISVARGAAVIGGSGELGTAITAVTPGTTVITNMGSLSAGSGQAISTSGRGLVFNHGTITGNVDLGGSESQFNNQIGGQFNSGANVRLSGGSGTLQNDATINPGGPGVFQRTQLTGSLRQSASGVLAVDLDFGGNRHDFLSVSGPSSFGGGIAPLTQNPVKDVWLGIASFDGGTGGGVAPTIVNSALLFSYNLRDSSLEPEISINADFKPRNVTLNKDQSAAADHLQATWNTADVKTGPLFGTYTSISDGATYKRALDAVAPDVTLARASSRGHESYAFLNRLMSCPYFIDGGTRLAEGECVWGRVIGGRTDRSATSEDIGYSSRQVTYQMGLQKEVAPDWFLGGSMSYARTNTTSSGRALEASTDGFQGGLTLKRQIGPWQFAGALHGGYESSTQRRDTQLPDFFARAHSKSNAYFVGARTRISYEIPFDGWYVKPFADVDLTYNHASAYRETGAGFLDLAYRATNSVGLMATPSIEVGGRIDFENGTLRPYLAAGVSFVSNGDAKVNLSLAEFSMTPFQITTSLPRTYGNLTAGLELVTKNGWELKAEYNLRGAKDHLTQSAALRMAMRF